MEICSTCGQEIRYGTRDGVTGYLHREPVDHRPTHGPVTTPEAYAAMLRRHHSNADVVADEDAEVVSGEVEPIEVYSTPLPYGGEKEAVLDGRHVDIPTSARSLITLTTGLGWEVARFTYSRGPYMSSSGKSLGVADFVVLTVRVRAVDGSITGAVGSWRNGKSDGSWWVRAGRTEPLGLKALREKMKENPDG